MATHFAVFTFLLLVSLVLAQHVHYEPDWVQSVVSYATSQYRPWVTYAPKEAPHSFRPGNHTQPYPFPEPSGTYACSFWLETIPHKGKAPFQPHESYKVFRNDNDYGAKGDGKADDTAAINAAISAGNRCAPG